MLFCRTRMEKSLLSSWHKLLISKRGETQYDLARLARACKVVLDPVEVSDTPYKHHVGAHKA